MAQLIADLDHPEFARRHKAMNDLKKLHEVAKSALQKTITEQSSPEKKGRATTLLKAIEQSREPIRIARIIRLLEHMSNPNARQLLESLTEGAEEAWLTQYARLALTRLTKQ
jgi:hypothetical protein